MFWAKRLKMIENFANARKPEVFISQFVQNLQYFSQNAEYTKAINEMKEKPKAPYKINADPKDLIKF